jgi:hypothetical protein
MKYFVILVSMWSSSKFSRHGLMFNLIRNTKSKDKNELNFTYVFYIEGNGLKTVKESKTLPYVTKWKIAIDDEYAYLKQNMDIG